MNNLVAIPLLPRYFSERETILASSGNLTASTFLYSTGVAGLRVTNSCGEIEVLPFQGQQIWRAKFYNRQLTMRSMFEEPNPTTDYLGTYGAFLIHCGVIGMGAPTPKDDHPTHGELPNAPYRQAELVVGSDAQGSYMTITGQYQYSVAFSHNYIAQPSITLRENHGKIHVEMSIKNLKSSPMELMYLAHINFLPVDNAKIVDTAPQGNEHLRVIHIFEELYKTDSSYRQMVDGFIQDPEKHRNFAPGGIIDPEIVFAVNPLSDRDGWASSMQIHPDGSADFVRHRPAEFAHSVRWICRSGDQVALGLLLPSTAEPGGYLAERAKGNLLTVESKAELRFAFECGALDASDALELLGEIADVRSASKE
jgi:Domain of unknown function (DUF4432)